MKARAHPPMEPTKFKKERKFGIVELTNVIKRIMIILTRAILIVCLALESVSFLKKFASSMISNVQRI